MQIQRLIILPVVCLLFILQNSVLYSQNHLCQLPEWALDLSNYNGLNRAIGISNPGMELDDAIYQAKIRALLNYNLLKNAKYHSLTTLNLGSQHNGSFNITDIENVVFSTIIKGSIPLKELPFVIDSFYTKNREAIVLVEVDPIDEDSLNGEYIIHRRAGFQRTGNSLPVFLDELEIEVYLSDSLICKSELYKNMDKIVEKKKREKESQSIMDYLEEIQNFYQYRNLGSGNKLSLPSQLNSGLWNAYIFNLIDQICIHRSLKADFHNKLSSSNVGNIHKMMKNETLEQFVYSIKNIQSVNFEVNIENMCTKDNQLWLFMKPKGEHIDFSQNTNNKLSRKERKELQKLKEDNWQYFGNQDFEAAWVGANNDMKYAGETLSASNTMRSNNLNSGILEAIQMAKLELSSQLDAKISALSNNEIKKSEQSHIQSSKLVNLTQTGKIEPFYIFYRKINQISFEVKVVLLYGN